MNIEQIPSPVQDLGFEQISRDSICEGVLQDSPQLFMTDGRWNLPALILSDNNPFTIQVAFYPSTVKEDCRRRTVLTGSAVSQLEQAISMLTALSDAVHPSYPPQAIREILCNCVCHRSYESPVPTQIGVYTDRIEFLTIGGLAQGLDIASVEMGIAASPNPALANILYLMGIIQNYGTGISKVRRLYKGEKSQPRFEAAGGVFKVTLPDCNRAAAEKRAVVYFASEKDQILSFARDQGMVTRREVEELLACGQTKSFGILKSLCRDGLLLRRGSGRNSVYMPV